MPDIRYVCLSDTHFGAETSLLTNLQTASSDLDLSAPSPVLKELVDCLRYLISQNEVRDEKPTLVLNGDILELALVEYNEAAMVFEGFIDLIMPEGEELFSRIIYNPGNHDHHLWEMARETQYVDNYISKVPWGDRLDPPWHATNMFKIKNIVKSYFLTQLIQRLPHLKTSFIEVAYPNYGVLHPIGQKCVIFHHGHLVESMYVLMSTLKNMLFPDRAVPQDVWVMEGENFAWIDFFWSALGRSQDVGKGVGCIYEKLQDPKQVKKLLSNLADSLAKKYDLPGWGDRMEAKFLEWALDMVAGNVGSLERNTPETVLSEDAEKGLWAYMEGPLKKQILGECENKVPPDVTFIFGHTHKPFQEDMNFKGYSGWVNVYNSGGWVVDTVDPEPLLGGAVILIDENLDATSLCMYNEAKNLNDYAVTVQQARHPGDPPSDFHTRIQDLVKESPGYWDAFSAVVARAVNVREQDLRARIKSPSY